MTHRTILLTRSIRRASASTLSLSLICGLALGNLAFSSFAFAQSTTVASARTVSFAIPAGPLDQVLGQFGRQAGIPVSTDASLTAGKSSPGLQGEFSVEQGFARILGGTGLTVVRQGDGSYLLAKAATDGSALELGATNISGQAAESAYGPVEGYVATRSATGTKTDTPILEIPQSINVVTADQVSTQGARSLTQALRYTPGVNTNGFSDRNMIADEISSRGFAPSPLYLDGAYLAYAGSLGGAPQIDPYTLERIEVFKGPASVLYGQNQPGGLINMVSKRPTTEPRSQIRLGAGSYSRLNGAIDTSGPIDEAKEFSYRLIGVAKKGNEQVEHTHSERMLLAPSLTWSPSENTSLTLLAQAQRDDGAGDYQSLPRIGTLDRGPDGKRIDRDFYSGDSNWNDYKRNQWVVGYDLTHRLNDDMKFRSTARYIDVSDRYKGFGLRGFVSAGGVTDYTQANRLKLDWQQHNTTYTVDNNLEYTFATGALQHTTLAGVDYRGFNRKYHGYNVYNVVPINLYGANNNYDTSGVMPVLDTKWDNSVRQLGVYVQDQIKLGSWILTIGGRHDWAEIENKDLMASTVTEQKDKKFTGRLGLTYVTEFGVAPYVSFSQSFVPTVGTEAPQRGGSAFDPTEGEQYEAGVKYQPFDKTLITASVFQLKQKDMLTTDTLYTQYSVQTGEVRTRGVEIEAKSSLDNIDVLASASYLDSFYTKNNGSTKGNRSEAQAPVQASLWVDYHFTQAALNGLTFGAGARYVGRKPGDSANSFYVPSFVVYDTTISYDLGKITPDLRGVKANLNVQNLFDREYVSSCNYAFGCYYGQERVAALEVSYDW